MKKSVQKALIKNIQSLIECRDEAKGKKKREIDRAINHLLSATRRK